MPPHQSLQRLGVLAHFLQFYLVQGSSDFPYGFHDLWITCRHIIFRTLCMPRRFTSGPCVQATSLQHHHVTARTVACMLEEQQIIAYATTLLQRRSANVL